MVKLDRALTLVFVLLTGASWAQVPANAVLKTAMADIDSGAPGGKPDQALSAKLSKAMNILAEQMDGGALSADDMALAHLYHAKAWYFLAVNDHAFTVADYDREDARAYVYEFEQAIDLMWDQASKTGKDWKIRIAEANYQAAKMVITIAVDTNMAYSRFLPACAALDHPECKRMMASAPK